MEYESEEERLSTNPSINCTGKNVPAEKRKKVVELLQDGTGTRAINAETGVSRPAIIAIRKDEEDAGKFELGTWKKQTASLLSQIVSKGSTRLLTEIENIPAGQLPLAIAIMTDKVMQLQDAPTTIVEHRLRVSHEDINAMLSGRKAPDAIDI